MRGGLRIHAFGDDPLSWGRMPEWWLRDEHGDTEWRPFRLKRSRLQGATMVASFEQIDDRTCAEGFKGWLVGAPREALPETAPGEYYWADLIGLEVVNVEGRQLGEVAGLLETGANAVLCVVDGAGTERLLPFVANVVLAVEKPDRRIRVDWGADW